MPEQDTETVASEEDGTGEQQRQEQEQEEEQPKVFDAEYVEKLRREAAKYRTEAKANATAAQKLKALEDAQKTDLERLQEQLTATTRERDEARVELTRVRLGLRYKLDEDDLDFLGAGSDEQMEERAKRLSERVRAARTPSFDGGARRTADAPTDMNSYLRRLAGQ